jgi:Tlde1 domain
MFAGQKPDPTWPQALPPDDHDPAAHSREPVGAKPNGVSSGAVGSGALSTGGAAAFAGQKPDPIWPQALPPDDNDPAPHVTEPVGAKPNGVSAGAVRAGALPIVFGIGLGLAALVFVGFVGTLMLPQAAAPNKAAALPPLASALPPLAESHSDSRRETVEPERPSTSEPPPIQIGVSHLSSLEAAPRRLSTVIPVPERAPLPGNAVAAYDSAPLPPPRPLAFAPAPSSIPATGYDKWTAVYDISAHTVYLPGGMRLEAHSGLGDRKDDPRFVDERDRGPTPPNLYELTLRESLFHGVLALRLTPIGGGLEFNRVGLLAHPYMLGPSGDSNGCVSFKNYDAFLRAFTSGEVKRLAVVARSTEDPREDGRLASLRVGLDR